MSPDVSAGPAEPVTPTVTAAANHAAGLVTGAALVAVDAARSTQMRQLFAEVFGHTMSAEHWHWKYADGRGYGVGLVDGHSMLAHYGGVTRQMRFRGQAVRACQICDVMVAPKANRALVRKGPLYRVSAQFLQQHVGDGQRHPLAYGFPNDRAHAVANRLGLYGQIDTTIGLAWPVADLAERSHCHLQPLGIGSDGAIVQSAVVDRLWSRMTLDFPESVLGVRDAHWLSHRYLRHPSLNYEVWLVRHGLLRRPMGVLVLRQREQHLDLMDLVGPKRAFATLIGVARRRARELGLARVEAWVTESHADLLRTSGHPPAAPTGMRLPLPHNLYTPGLSVAEMRGRWFLLGGDADFT